MLSEWNIYTSPGCNVGSCSGCQHSSLPELIWDVHQLQNQDVDHLKTLFIILVWLSISQKVSTISRNQYVIRAPCRTFTCYHCSLTCYYHLLLKVRASAMCKQGCNRSWSAKPDVWLCINGVYGKAKSLLSSHSNTIDSALQPHASPEEWQRLRLRRDHVELSLCFFWMFLSDCWTKTTQRTWSRLSRDGATRPPDFLRTRGDTKQWDTRMVTEKKEGKLSPGSS